MNGRRPGNFFVALVLIASSLGILGCSTGAPNDTDEGIGPAGSECADVGGTWRGSSSGGEYPELVLSQTACDVAGSLYSPGSCPARCGFEPSPIEGRVQGDAFSFVIHNDPEVSCDGCELICLREEEATMTVAGDAMEGEVRFMWCDDQAAQSVSVSLVRSMACLDVAVALFRGGPDICPDFLPPGVCFLLQGDNSLALDSLKTLFELIDPERVEAIVIDQADSEGAQLRQAAAWFDDIVEDGCDVPQRLLVGHSWGGDTVRLSQSLGDAYRVAIDPISRETSLAWLSPPACAFCPLYQRECEFGGPVDVNFLAEDLSLDEQLASLEQYPCPAECLRGYEIPNALRIEEPGTDHQDSIIEAAWPYLRDLVQTWLQSN